MESETTPVGSTWYGWGQHFEVLEEVVHDGEPAVRCRYTTTRGTFKVLIRHLLRHAEQTNYLSSD